jgi:homoserine dehydrogenase
VILVNDPLNIALIGCGTVGGGVAKLLLEQPARLAARAARPLVLRRVVVRDVHKPRAVPLPREMLTTDLNVVLRDPNIQVAAELVGGVDWARRAVLSLLEAGKDVVTANKALLAQDGAEVFDAARKHGRCVAFEASVAGGVPIIAALAQSLARRGVPARQPAGNARFAGAAAQDGAAGASARRLQRHLRPRRRGRRHALLRTGCGPNADSERRRR